MMRTNCLLTLSNGRHIDLLNPRAQDIDFLSIAEHLAKEKRYNGATPGNEYSVAEHTCRGVEAIIAAGEGEEVAREFLMHDCPEACLKDDTTPKKRAIEAIAQNEFGILAGAITKAYDGLTERFDAAIHEAAGLPWPMREDVAARVKHWDVRMFVTEWRDLMFAKGIQHPEWERYQHIAPLPVTIHPWSWRVARSAFIGWCERLLPTMQRSNV